MSESSMTGPFPGIEGEDGLVGEGAETRILSLKDHRLQKQFGRALEKMEQRMMWWKVMLREGDPFITVDEEGMVYGRILEFIGPPIKNAPQGPKMMAVCDHWSAGRPRGWREEVFTAQIWGLLSEEQFQRARELGWPAARGRFLDEVVTEDSRYTIWYTYADYTPPEEM